MSGERLQDHWSSGFQKVPSTSNSVNYSLMKIDRFTVDQVDAKEETI